MSCGRVFDKLTISSVMLVAVFVLTSTSSSYAALDVASCDALEREHKLLQAEGLEIDRSKGPEWAQANLSAKRVNKIMRFIRVEELIKFQCIDVFARADIAEELRQAREETKRRLEEQRKRKAEEQAAALANVPPLPERKPFTEQDTHISGVDGASGTGGPPLPERKRR